MNFDYNTTRKKLILAEYGRNVQNMVAYICDLPTKEKRNQYAQVVIDLMGFLNPHLRDVADFKHKLWDHLHIISDFKIDVDSPYPKPSAEAIHIKPEPLAYPNQRIRFKHYGKTIELMIQKAKVLPESDRKQQMVQSIANFMKLAYMTWNKDTVSDETIINDLRDISNGELTIQDINLSKFEVRPNAPGSRSKSSVQNQNKNKQNNRNQGRQRNGGGKRY